MSFLTAITDLRLGSSTRGVVPELLRSATLWAEEKELQAARGTVQTIT